MGVIGVLQGCFRCGTRRQKRFKIGVPWLGHGCYMSVINVLHGSYKVVGGCHRSMWLLFKGFPNIYFNFPPVFPTHYIPLTFSDLPLILYLYLYLYFNTIQLLCLSLFTKNCQVFSRQFPNTLYVLSQYFLLLNHQFLSCFRCSSGNFPVLSQDFSDKFHLCILYFFFIFPRTFHLLFWYFLNNLPVLFLVLSRIFKIPLEQFAYFYRLAHFLTHWKIVCILLHVFHYSIYVTFTVIFTCICTCTWESIKI